MKANLENIQKIYNEIPNSFIYEGLRIDNYKKSELHFEHGWRDVVVPEIAENQKLGTEYILFNDNVTKEVIELTLEEVEIIKSDKIIEIKREYEKTIHELIYVHVQKNVMRGVPISIEITEKYNDLRAEYNKKISEL